MRNEKRLMLKLSGIIAGEYFDLFCLSVFPFFDYDIKMQTHNCLCSILSAKDMEYSTNEIG